MARQGSFFDAATGHAGCADPAGQLALSRDQLLAWQQRLVAFQAPLFARRQVASAQTCLFASQEAAPTAQALSLDPLELQPQALSFWRWPQAPQRGAAVYFVLDRPPALDRPLLLYVGETGRADRRWKGAHDCKHYLAAYGEALVRAGLEGRPSIRFCLDVPAAARPRRALEQALIRHWQPPFNKETRERWATPFTAGPDPA